MSPAPSYCPGLVLGFQIPARSACTFPVAATCFAVASVCSSVSALHGPLITIGLLAAGNHDEIGWSWMFFFIAIIVESFLLPVLIVLIQCLQAPRECDWLLS